MSKEKAAKKAKKERSPEEWAKAKKLCRLNEEDIARAKRLGFDPRSLIKNIPNKSQRWKAPVKVWLRELEEKQMKKQGGTQHETHDETLSEPAADRAAASEPDGLREEARDHRAGGYGKGSSGNERNG